MRGDTSRTPKATSDLPFDRLEAAHASVQVVLLSDQSYPEDGDCGFRRPHRHDYHELIWVRRGVGSHLIDGQRSIVQPKMVTVIGKGQVPSSSEPPVSMALWCALGDEILEQHYARSHEAGEYAEGLAVPQAVLSRALAEITGRRTKELITDRRMLEAARMLRFTDSTIREVASRSGFSDQIHFSRAFKRYYGDAPTEYRDRARGR